jgi:hypothetical protein
LEAFSHLETYIKIVRSSKELKQMAAISKREPRIIRQTVLRKYVIL